jgi:hypothetical protein
VDSSIRAAAVRPRLARRVAQRRWRPRRPRPSTLGSTLTLTPSSTGGGRRRSCRRRRPSSLLQAPARVPVVGGHPHSWPRLDHSTINHRTGGRRPGRSSRGWLPTSLRNPLAVPRPGRPGPNSRAPGRPVLPSTTTNSSSSRFAQRPRQQGACRPNRNSSSNSTGRSNSSHRPGWAAAATTTRNSTLSPATTTTRHHTSTTPHQASKPRRRRWRPPHPLRPSSPSPRPPALGEGSARPWQPTRPAPARAGAPRRGRRGRQRSRLAWARWPRWWPPSRRSWPPARPPA